MGLDLSKLVDLPSTISFTKNQLQNFLGSEDDYFKTVFNIYGTAAIMVTEA